MTQADQEYYNELVVRAVEKDNALIDAEQQVLNIIQSKIAKEEEYVALKEAGINAEDIEIDKQKGAVRFKDSAYDKVSAAAERRASTLEDDISDKRIELAQAQSKFEKTRFSDAYGLLDGLVSDSGGKFVKQTENILALDKN